MARQRSNPLAIENHSLREAIKCLERVCNAELDKLNARILELETENAQLRDPITSQRYGERITKA